MKNVICKIFGHKIDPALDLTELKDVYCKRCHTLLSRALPQKGSVITIRKRSYLNGCVDKKRFPTYKAASERMDRMKVRPATLHVYVCRHCGGYHLGNYKVSRRRK
jgi:RNase P subunit RPR2